MTLKHTTPVPNDVIDLLVPHLTMAELKVLLVIIRATYGWVLPNGKRKTRDWISQSQFKNKTGLSRQTISTTLHMLSEHNLVSINDRGGAKLTTPQSRKGKSRLYYSLGTLEHVRLFNLTCNINNVQHVRLSVQDKRNSTKEKKTKGIQKISSILKRMFI